MEWPFWATVVVQTTNIVLTDHNGRHVFTDGEILVLSGPGGDLVKEQRGSLLAEYGASTKH